MNEYKAFFKTVGGNEGTLCHYPTRLDTYGKGCQHDCAYCYARSLLEFRGLWNSSEPSCADLKKVEKVLDKIPAGTILRLGGMTDCFQPCEVKHFLTLKTIKMMNERDIGYLIVTKSDLVATEPYMSVMRKDLAHIQITVTFTDDDVALTYEKATLISRRIKAIEKLYEAGFDVCLRLSPFIPDFVDLEKINRVKCDKVLVEFLRSNSSIRRIFQIDYTPYAIKHGGYWHLPLDAKIKALQGLKGKQVSVCDDVPSHYKWFKENYNPNPDDCCNLRRENA